MDNKRIIKKFALVIFVIVMIFFIVNKIQGPEKRIAKEIAESMVSRERFVKTFEKNCNYKALAALKKTLGSEEFEQAITDLDSKEVGNLVEKNYSKVTDAEINEVKSSIKDIVDKMEIPYKELKLDEMSKPYDDAFCPCFKDRTVILQDSSGKSYFYIFVYYDNKLVDIVKKF